MYDGRGEGVTALGRTCRAAKRLDFEFESFMSLSHQYIQRYCWSIVSPEDAARARMLLELLFIRSGAFCLDSFSVSDVKLLIDVSS